MNQRVIPPRRAQQVVNENKMEFRRPASASNAAPAGTKVNPPTQTAGRPVAPAAAVYSVEELEQMANTAQVSKPTVERDPAYVDVTLPSNFYFYRFKRLAVRSIRGGEQAKFARAARDGRLRHVVDAISATLEPGVSAYDLTMQDFNWLLYYQRLNSYKKVPYIHKTYCENADHLQKVINQELKEETLQISQIISNSSLKETIFNPEQIKQPSFVHKLALDTVRMRDLVEVSEMDEDPNFQELAWLADRAAFIAPTQKYKTLRDRIKVVQVFNPEQMDELKLYMDSVTNYGVQESINVRCEGCGAEKVSEVTIDALSFLPSH